MESVKLRVDGMSCGHCEIAIQNAVHKLPGIKKVKASKRKKDVDVQYDDTLLSLNQIVCAINYTGYCVIP